MRSIVKVAAVQMPIVSETDRDVNIENACSLLQIAAKGSPDIVCLPELFNGLAGISTLPGPETEKIGELARQHNMYVIAPFYVLSEGNTYNCSVLIDRKGEVAGCYQKVHLWPWEAPVSKITPGKEFPVFETDFGRIGLCICHDHQFPETARCLALKGAEVLFCSTRMPDPFQFPWLTLSRVRALENQMYVVSVGAEFNDCSTHIVAPRFRGEVLSSAGVGTHVLQTELDLDWLRKERTDSPLYKYPEKIPSDEAEARLRETVSYCYFKDRRPETYGIMTKTGR